jgi:CBS domain containing-hemolysin-like protein
MPKSQDNSKHPQGIISKYITKLKTIFPVFFKVPDLDLPSYTSSDEGIIGGGNFPQHQIMNNFKKFSYRTIEDIMVPRLDIIAIKDDVNIEDLSKFIVDHGHSRTLIYKDTLDNIVGFVHIKDLFKIITESKKYNLKKLMRKHIICTPSMKLVDLLTQMKIHRTHIAVVVDEYGGTDGLVTIEDIIEEIVGRIEDEHDDANPIDSYKIIKPGLIISNARVSVEEMEQILAVKLKNENDAFDTIGGLVMAKVGKIPEKGKIISITDEIIIEILDSTPKMIQQLKITYNAKNSSKDSVTKKL